MAAPRGAPVKVLPPLKSGRGGTIESIESTAAFAARCREKPGVWFKMHGQHWASYADYVRHGKMAAFAPAGDYDARIRRERVGSDRGTIYVRYIGQTPVEMPMKAKTIWARLVIEYHGPEAVVGHATLLAARDCPACQKIVKIHQAVVRDMRKEGLL